MAREIEMTLAKSIGIPGCGGISIDAAFLAMGFVGVGQADGPYPGMYEHWSSGHKYESSGFAGQLEQTALVEENKP